MPGVQLTQGWSLCVAKNEKQRKVYIVRRHARSLCTQKQPRACVLLDVNQCAVGRQACNADNYSVRVWCGQLTAPTYEIA